MEIYKPVLLKKAKKRIELREQQKINLKKSFLENKKDLDSPACIKLQLKSAQKIIKQIQAEDLLTDDSMKDIDYRDIDMVKEKSQDSEDSHDDDQIEKSKQKLTQLLCSSETPVEYYAKLKKQREAKEITNCVTVPKKDDDCCDTLSKDSGSQVSSQRFMEEIMKKNKLRPKVFHAETVDEQGSKTENSINIVKTQQKNKALDKFLQEIQHNVDSDNFEDLARKQAELNIAKSILNTLYE